MSDYEALRALAEAASDVPWVVDSWGDVALEFIAAADPTAVLGLLDEVERLRERLAFSEQTTTNVMDALAESGAETAAAEAEVERLRGAVECVEALLPTAVRHDEVGAGWVRTDDLRAALDGTASTDGEG